MSPRTMGCIKKITANSIQPSSQKNLKHHEYRILKKNVILKFKENMFKYKSIDIINYSQLLYREVKGNLQRVPNPNFAYKTSRVQRGMFRRQNWSREPVVK